MTLPQPLLISEDLIWLLDERVIQFRRSGYESFVKAARPHGTVYDRFRQKFTEASYVNEFERWTKQSSFRHLTIATPRLNAG